jgi:hypothetical protein
MNKITLKLLESSDIDEESLIKIYDAQATAWARQMEAKQQDAN